MSLPSRDQTFGFANSRDLLEKLDRELDRYRDTTGHHDAEGEALYDVVNRLKDNAFNACVTAWQLCDWVFSDMTIEQKSEHGFRKLTDLQKYARTNCRALYLCRHAATASKHWIVSQYPDAKIQVLVGCDDEAGWGVLFVDSGKPVPADQVFASALGFWTSFIYEQRISQR